MALRRRRRKLTTTLTNVDRRLREVERRRAPKRVVPAAASITVEQLAEDVPVTAAAVSANTGTIKTVPPAVYKRVIAKQYKTFKSFIKRDKATLTTDIAHELVVGDKILVSGLNSQFDLTAPGTYPPGYYTSLDHTYWTVTEVPSDYQIVFTREWEGKDSATLNIAADTVAWKAVTTKAITSNVVTLTIGSGHTFVVGDRVNVDGVGVEFDGNYTITAKTSTTVSYKTANDQENISASAGDGGVYPTLIKYVQVGDTWSDPTDGALYSWTGLKWEQVNVTAGEGAFVPDDIAPKIPTSLAGVGTAYYDVRDPRARVVLTWVAPTENVDDTPIEDLVGYDIFYRTLVTDDWKFLISVTDLTYTHEGLKQGVALRYAVKAYDKSDNRSDYSAEIFLTTPVSVVVINRPSAPQLTSRLGTVTVRWDGLDYLGNAMGDTFAYIEIHRSTTSGFTPSTTTAVGRLNAAPELYVDTDLTYATTYYYKFVAINLAGGVTTASTQASVSVNRLVDTDLIANTLSTWPFAGQVVSASAIADGSIDVFKIANGAVNADKILANAVTELKIAANAVSSAMIQVNAVTSSQLGPNAVTQAKIADAAISAAKIGANAVEAGKIAANAVGLGSIAANAVTAATITAGAITAGKIDTGAVTAATIAANAITAGKIDANAVTATTIAANAIEAGKIAANAVVAGSIAANAVTANQIAANAITAAKIVAGTISATEIAANAIVSNLIAANAIGANQIAAGAIIAGKIGADAVTANTIAALSISTGMIQSNAIKADNINAGAITGTKISADAIDGKVITGATVRTSASNPKVQMDTTGLYFTNSSSVNVLSIVTSTGAASFRGSINIGVGLVTTTIDSATGSVSIIDTGTTYGGYGAFVTRGLGAVSGLTNEVSIGAGGMRMVSKKGTASEYTSSLINIDNEFSSAGLGIYSGLYLQADSGKAVNIIANAGTPIANTARGINMVGIVNNLGASFSTGEYEVSSTATTVGAIMTSTGAIVSRRDNNIPFFAGKFSVPSGATEMIRFTVNAVNRGGINASTSGNVAFSQPSDYRLKEHIRDYTGSIDVIKSKKVRVFNLKDDPDKTEIVGFVAHEFADDSSELVVGEKDAVDADGNPKYQSILTTNILPFLVGALKDTILNVEKLENRITTLEA